MPVRNLLIAIVYLLIISGIVGEEAVYADRNYIETGYIDTHVHLDSGHHPEDKGDFISLLRKSANVKIYEKAAVKLIAKMDKMGVAKALIAPPPQVVGKAVTIDYMDILGIVKEYPDRLFFVAGGKTLNPLIHSHEMNDITPEFFRGFEKRAEDLIKAGAKAFGEMAVLKFSFGPQDMFAEAYPDHPLFLLLADIAARHDVPIDLHMEAVPHRMASPPGFDRVKSNNPSILHANIEALERLLSHNRDARIVWQHIGWDNTGHMTVELLRQLLKAHPNLYLALRVEERRHTITGSTIPNRIIDKRGRIRGEWLKLFKDFSDRFMIGSDEFVGVSGKISHKSHSFELTWSILDQLPSYLARRIGRDNALRVYRLE